MTSPQTLLLRVGSAHVDREEQFPLPPGWTATVCPPRGLPELSAGDVEQAFAEPVGCEPISRAARGATNAVVLVDDFRRPTPAERLALMVLEELNRAGVPDERVRLVLGNGAHRPMNRSEARARLGEAYGRVGKVVSHDAFSADVAFLGLTSAGTPVLVNAEATGADFSVSISTVYPHALTTWGGGAKLVLPGISHVSTIHYHHSKVAAGAWAGSPASCASRQDVEEAGRLFALKASVCCVVNARRELAGLTLGEPVACHRRAVALARRAGDTPVPEAGYDLVIANAYPFDADGTQLSKPHIPAQRFGCPVLIISDFADPTTYHGLYHGPLTRYRRRPQPRPVEHTPELLSRARVFMYSPQYGKGFLPEDRSWYCDDDWVRLMAALSERFPHARVAVLPAAPLQTPRFVSGSPDGTGRRAGA